MALSLQILGSSSSGNCAFLRTESAKVLVEAGFSAKKLKSMLEQIGESLGEIDAVFLTHEHGDHAVGLRGLAKYEHIQIFANKSTAQATERSLKKKLNWSFFEVGKDFIFKDLKIQTFPIPHDAYDPVGFVFESGEGTLFSPQRRLAWVTDLGHVPGHLEKMVSDVELLVIEANYDDTLLDEDTRRPWATKERIRGTHGHLSNIAARDFLQSVQKPRWKQVHLAHLSKDCNSVARVKEAFTALQNAQLGYQISVVDPAIEIGPKIDLGIL